MKKTFIIIIILGFSLSITAQLTVSFLPVNEYFYTKDQIWNFNILNTGKRAETINLEISLLRNGSSPVMTAKLSNYKLERGLNLVTTADKILALTTFGNDPTSTTFQNTGILPPGNYAICVSIKSNINQVLSYTCQEIQINSFTLPVLQSPYNLETIHTSIPLFTWLPVMPATTDNLTYKLEIWKKSKGVNFKASGNLYETTLSRNSFQYYSGLPLLENGKSYTWKVSAYSGDFYLGSSEIWDFTVNTTSNAKIAEEEELDSYRIINNETANALYTAENVLKIKYENIANDSLLNYSISLVENPDSVISELPEIQLLNGINKIDIDLAELGTLESNRYYLLEIEDANERQYFLRFFYTEL